VKTQEGLELPAAGTKGAGLSANEMKMAEQLVNDMQGPWNPEEFKDEFKHAIMELVQKKVAAGKTQTVVAPEEDAPSTGAEIIDLTELLARSLKKGGTKPDAAKAAARSVDGPATKASAKSPAAKAAAPAKAARTAQAAKARKAA
jgi:DNA end-binding protein Ku